MTTTMMIMTFVLMRKPWRMQRPSTTLKKCMLGRTRSLALWESCYHTHHWQLWEKLELKTGSPRLQFLGVWLVVLERSKGLYVLAGGSSILHGDSINNIGYGSVTLWCWFMQSSVHVKLYGWIDTGLGLLWILHILNPVILVNTQTGLELDFSTKYLLKLSNISNSPTIICTKKYGWMFCWLKYTFWSLDVIESSDIKWISIHHTLLCWIIFCCYVGKLRLNRY